jgi:hypothetical protein
MLGPARYKLFKDGKLQLHQMVKDNKIIPLPKVTPKPPVKPTLTPFQEYEKAQKAVRDWQAKHDISGGWSIIRGVDSNSKYYPLKKLRQKEFDAYVNYVNKAPKAVQVLERRGIADRMTAETRRKYGPQFMTPSKMQKTVEGADHLPFRLLADMERNGADVVWHKRGSDYWRQHKGRAHYNTQWGRGQIHLFEDTAEIVAHEMGHMVDGFFSRSGLGFEGRAMGQWKDSAYVSRKEGSAYRSWYKNQHSGKRGTFKNGDGEFWKNNWIENYEGRIYRGGVGEQWFAMNNQYYWKYKTRYDRYPDELKELKKLLPKMKDKYAIKGTETKIADMEALGRDGWALRNTKWGTARKKYPELSKFIEKLYTTDLPHPSLVLKPPPVQAFRRSLGKPPRATTPKGAAPVEPPVPVRPTKEAPYLFGEVPAEWAAVNADKVWDLSAGYQIKTYGKKIPELAAKWDATTEAGRVQLIRTALDDVAALAKKGDLYKQFSDDAIEYIKDMATLKYPGQEQLLSSASSYLRTGKLVTAHGENVGTVGLLAEGSPTKLLRMVGPGGEKTGAEIAELFDIACGLQREWMKNQGVKSFNIYRGMRLDGATINAIAEKGSFTEFNGTYWSTNPDYAELYIPKGGVVVNRKVLVDEIQLYYGGDAILGYEAGLTTYGAEEVKVVVRVVTK